MCELARVAVLVGTTGRGSNMQALAQACLSGSVPAAVACVVAISDSSPALARATELGLEAVAIPFDDEFGGALLSELGRRSVAWICLAGFLRLLPSEVLAAYPRRILNIHPALLPQFGGKGMYGLRVHEAVLASGARESGCTIHYASEQYDAGEIILQLKCPVEPGDSPETLAARVLALEHRAYPEALKIAIERAG